MHNLRSPWLKWPLSVIALVAVVGCAIAYLTPLGRTTAEEAKRSNDAFAQLQEMEKRAVSTSAVDTPASSEQAALKSALENMKFGKALYGKGLYDDARQAFLRARKLAPELSEAARWIANCDREIAIRGTVYVSPQVVAQKPEPPTRSGQVARSTGGWAAQPGSRAAPPSAHAIPRDQRQPHPAQHHFYDVIDDPNATLGEVGHAMLEAQDEIDREYQREMRRWQ